MNPLLLRYIWDTCNPGLNAKPSGTCLDCRWLLIETKEGVSYNERQYSRQGATQQNLRVAQMPSLGQKGCFFFSYLNLRWALKNIRDSQKSRFLLCLKKWLAAPSLHPNRAGWPGQAPCRGWHWLTHATCLAQADTQT